MSESTKIDQENRSRLRYVEVTEEGLAILLTGARLIEINSAIPDDAICQGVWCDPTRKSILIRYWHPSFPPVHEGCLLRKERIEICERHSLVSKIVTGNYITNGN